MNILLGRNGNLALYGNDHGAVVLDTELDLIVASGEPVDLVHFSEWSVSEEFLSVGQQRLCNLAIESETERAAIVAAGNRMYSIPEGVKKEAEKALEWRKKHGRGGTPVGMNTARTLAKGGQLGIKKVRHIAKFFPRHEKNKKAKGWSPGEDGFPSNGRIAWALWGGDAAWRWARAITEREDKKKAEAVVASGLDPFSDAYALEDGYGPEFMARVNLDGSGIDRLYKIEANGDVRVWDDNSWDDMGNLSGTTWSYDKDLDETANDSCTHVLIDIDSAVKIAAKLAVDPFGKVAVESLDEEESYMTALGMKEEDWELVDRVMTAAGEPLILSDASGLPPADADGDGKLDTAFLSEKAKDQPRDAGGKFIKVGSRTVVGNDKARGSGVIESIDYDNDRINVKLDSGKSIAVAPQYLQSEADFDGPSLVPKNLPPLNLEGIVAEPRTPQNMPLAHLPGTLPPLSQSDIRDMMNNWDSFVAKQRNSYRLYDDNPKGLKEYDRGFVKKRHGLTDKQIKDAPVVSSAKTNEKMTPETADVIKYLAIVSPDDPRVVIDLVALIPASTQRTAPTTYKRQSGKWVEDEQILLDLKSASPPPILELDQKALNFVLAEADNLTGPENPMGNIITASMISMWFAKTGDINAALVAAGGIDRNRGGAARLRRYWTRGKGAAKIRWGTPGDWTRCVRQLSKYMGPRAKGYCQLRHKEVTGVYTGSRFNVGKKKGRTASATMFANESVLDEAMIKKSELVAKAGDARQKVALIAASTPVKQGARFYIPTLIPEEVESGDGRKFKSGSISARELPVPLMWQIKTGSGHDGSVVVGRIDYIERIEGGMGNAYGVFDTGPYGQEAERLVRNGFLRGVSVDLDQFEATESKKDKKEAADDDQEIGKDKIVVNKARIMAATIVAKPAFQECSISIQETGDQEETVTPEDGIYEESLETFSNLEPITASGYLESEIPLTPPTQWFENPKLTRPTPIMVDQDGRIYGHIAAWHVSHIGLPRSTKPPRSRSKYAYFHTGVVRTDGGKDIPVGQLTLAGGHAPLNADAASAAKHYDDTASAVADVHVGEDEFGIWCAGSLRPTVDEMQVRALRASAPSGDWRPINGSLELVAVCQVNVPGFPVARAMVASGKIMALVAAGASELAILKSQAVGSLVAKADMLAQLSATAPNLKVRVREAKKKVREANLETLTASASKMRETALVAAAVAELAKISENERMALAKEGKAMPDGAYPIRNVEDLKNAIQAYGRAKRSERRAVRKHIMKRARQLKQYKLVPEHWKTMSINETARQAAEMRKSITAAASKAVVAAPKVEEISEEELKKLRKAKEEADEQTEEEIEAAKEVKANRGNLPERDKDGRVKFVSGVNQPRDAKGKYRKVLARLKQDLGVAGLTRALQKVEEAENLDFAGNYEASVDASGDLLGMLDRMDSGALNPEMNQNIKLSAAELGKAISNLPLPFGKDASKLKFSDLPTGLKDLIEQMMSRVEARIGKEDADIATQKLRAFKSGADLFSQSEIQSEMATMLRLLT